MPWPARSEPFTEMSRRPAGALGSAVTSATSEPSTPKAASASMSLSCVTARRAWPVVRVWAMARLAMSSTALDQWPWKEGTDSPAAASCEKRPLRVSGWPATSPSACSVPASLPSVASDTVVSSTRRRGGDGLAGAGRDLVGDVARLDLEFERGVGAAEADGRGGGARHPPLRRGRRPAAAGRAGGRACRPARGRGPTR